MIRASVDLNKALESFINVCENFKRPDIHKVCEITGEAGILAEIKFLKTYELCIRADETLSDILRHKTSKEVEPSFGRIREILSELTLVVKSFKEMETSILVSKLTPEFFEYRDKISEVLGQRPGARIWDESGIETIATSLSKAIGELRKSAAYSLLLVSKSDYAEKYLGRLVC